MADYESAEGDPTLVDPRDLGAKCDQCPFKGRKPVRGPTNRNAVLVILGEGPGRDEELQGREFVGKSGNLLRAAAEKLSIPLARCHITNAMLCRPPHKATASQMAKAVACCRPRLRRELGRVKAKTILAFGRYALEATCYKRSIFNWMGTPLDGVEFTEEGKPVKRKKDQARYSFKKWKILGSLHPAYCLREPAYTPVLQIHMSRAWSLANGTLPPWEWPQIITEPGPAMLDAMRYIKESDDIIGSDVETSGLDPIMDTLLDVGVSGQDVAVSLPWYRADQKHKRAMKDLLYHGPLHAGQNYQHDMISFLSNGFSKAKLWPRYNWDTMTGFAIVAPQLKKGLAFQSCVEFHAPRWKDEFKGGEESGTNRYVSADPTERAIYNAKDCYMTLLLVERQQARLADTKNGFKLFWQMMELTKIALQMRIDGIRIDPTKLARHKKALGQRRTRALNQLYVMATDVGVDNFNPHSSSPSTANVLVNKMGVIPTAYTDTGRPQFNAKVLLDIATGDNQRAAAFAIALLKFRRWDKLLSTYVTGMETHYQDSTWYKVGKRHGCSKILVANPGWQPIGTKTGRWASRNPNLMNIPKPKYEKQKRGGLKLVAPGLRDIFCARPGCYLVAADYSQLEARIIALLSGDETLLGWYADGKDVHYETAKIAFQTDNPTKKERDMLKTPRYCVHYGGSVQQLWRTMVIDYPLITFGDCKRLYEILVELHDTLFKYLQGLLRKARLDGYIEAPLSGRRFHFYGQVEPSKVFNLPVQMTAADIINPAAIKIARALKKDERLLLQVHDDLTGESPRPAELRALLKKYMEHPISLNGNKFVFPVDFKVGVNWGEAIEVPDLASFEKEVRRLT